MPPTDAETILAAIAKLGLDVAAVRTDVADVRTEVKRNRTLIEDVARKHLRQQKLTDEPGRTRLAERTRRA